MAEKDFSQICKEAKKEFENDDSEPWQPESDNAYNNENVELGEEQKNAIDRIVGDN